MQTIRKPNTDQNRKLMASFEPVLNRNCNMDMIKWFSGNSISLGIVTHQVCENCHGKLVPWDKMTFQDPMTNLTSWNLLFSYVIPFQSISHSLKTSLNYSVPSLFLRQFQKPTSWMDKEPSSNFPSKFIHGKFTVIWSFAKPSFNLNNNTLSSIFTSVVCHSFT